MNNTTTSTTPTLMAIDQPGCRINSDTPHLTLTAHGFTRNRMRRLQPPQVTSFPVFDVDGYVLPIHANPALCARCALTRWLAVLDAYRHRSGRDIEDLLTNSRAHPRPRHDCLDPPDDGWRTIPRLVPAIDQYGAITPGEPITGRALTAILTRRFTPGPTEFAHPVTAETTERKPGRRPTHNEQDDLARLYDRIGAEADTLNARIEAVLKGLK